MTEGPQDPNEVVITSKATEPRKNVTRDPHASLSLFAPRDDDDQNPTVAASRKSAAPPPRDYKDLFGDNDDAGSGAQQRPESPKKGTRPGSKDQSAKPPPRDYHDLFVGGDTDTSLSAKGRPASPQKENAPLAKAGAGKNFQPNRLFGDVSEQPSTPGASSPEKARKPHPTKFNHFDFSDEPPESSQQALPARPKTKHQSQWDFADFSTPEKLPQKIRSQDVRHFGFGEDDTAQNSPPKNPNVPQPRPDSKSHFELLDDATPPGATKRATGPPRGHAADRGAGLYKSTLFHDDGSVSPEKKGSHPLSTVTNLKDRRKDFDPHFEMNDQSPAGEQRQAFKPISEARSKVVKGMDAQWETSDQSPEPMFQAKANGKENKGIKTGGDGMGGRKNAMRSWGFGDDSDGDGEGGVNAGRFQPQRKQQGRKDDDFWDH